MGLMSIYLPDGCTDADVDRAAGGDYEPDDPENDLPENDLPATKGSPPWHEQEMECPF
jgi:hypothetical protein